jgi:hydrogenase maturation protease
VTHPRILVAGVGNIFLGDDAFGVEVVRRLAERPLPEGVRVIDFGIRGFDLTYALLDGYETAILVDATQRGGQPGTPTIFDTADVTVLTKMDLAAAVEFDAAAAHQSIESVRPGMQVFEVSAKTGGGMEDWLRFLESQDIASRSAC